MVGLSDAWSGVIQDTASTGNLIALLCARERATDFSLAGGGLQAEARPLTVYVSAQSHSSVEKAALLAGFGRDERPRRRRTTPPSRCGRTPWRKRSARTSRRGDGRVPSSPRPARRPPRRSTRSAAIADVAARHGLWLHVDAAMAGSAMILPECRWMWDGVERADSLVFNPHKWLGAAFDCSLYYVRDPEHLVRVMSTSPSYLQTAADGRVKNYRDWGIALGRRFRALKLWFLIRSRGRERVAGPAAAGHRQREVAGGAGRGDPGLEGGRPGAAADGVRPSTSRRG